MNYLSLMKLQNILQFKNIQQFYNYLKKLKKNVIY